MRARFPGVALLLIVSPLVVAQAKKPNLGNLEAIKSDRLKAHLEFIASDLLEGRDTPSRGLDIAAEYIATQLKLWGVAPGGVKGTYFQPFPVRQIQLDGLGSSLEIAGTKYKTYKDFIPQFAKGKGSGGLVFVGNGFRLPSSNLDPYKNVNVRGKIIVRIETVPKEWNWNDFFAQKLVGAETPEQAATSHGAAGILVIPQDATYARWDDLARRIRDQRIPMAGGDNFGGSLPIGTISKEIATSILADEPQTYDKIQEAAKAGMPIDGFALKDAKTATFEVALQENSTMTKNVVGIIRGTDPKLREEYVAMGAHYDHVGKAGDGPGDTIYNGADDDGSGTVAILELAHAFATGAKPKRSLIFVWHAGEEKGLWGSDIFTKNPTVPIKSIVTQLNIDMIGRSKKAGDTDPRNKSLSGPDAIYVIGSRRLSTELGDTVGAINKKLYGLNFDYEYDKPNDPEHFYERSDHYNYARFGIPIAFFFDGVHEDYHQVGDEVQKIDFRKMEKVTRTVFGIAWTIGNQPVRPKVDKKIS